MKKLLVLVLALCLMLGCFGTFATAETDGKITLRYNHVVAALWQSDGEETNTVTIKDDEYYVYGDEDKKKNSGSHWYEYLGEDEIDIVPDGTYTLPVKIYGGYGTLDTVDFNNSELQTVHTKGELGEVLAYNYIVDVGNDGSYSHGFQGWQWRANGDASTVIILTAEEDMFLDVYHLNWRNPGSGDEWATNMTIAQYVVDPEGTIVKVAEGKVTETDKRDFLYVGVHLKAGDKCIVELQGSGYKPGTTQNVPHFEIDLNGYDASKRMDFDNVRALVTAKNDAYKAIDDAAATYNKADYTSARWSSISDIVNEAKAAIKDMLSEDDIKAAVDQAKADMDAVLTIAEEEAALNARRDEKKAELASAFNPEYYTKKNWEKIQAIIDEANAKIDAAKNVAAMNTAITVAKTAAAEVKMGGCGTTKQAEAGIVLGGLAAAIVVFTKKREN